VTSYTLQRTVTSEEATLGKLTDEVGTEVCKTLELPWRDNKHNLSCIPAGVYTAHRYRSPKRGYDVFMLDNVPGRDAVELHIGNTTADTDGCILLGSYYGNLGDQAAVLLSGDAFRKFMAHTGDDVRVITLTILDPKVSE
jgi:hypothetical protein